MSGSLTCSDPARIRRTGFFMGGPWEILAYGPPVISRRAVAAAFSEVARLESLLSLFRPESEIARINRLGRMGKFRVDPEAGRVIALALKFAEKTGGAYDPTLGVLKRLWGFGPEGVRPERPRPAEVEKAIACVGYRHISIESQNSLLEIRRPDIELDLGGIGKGYAMDRAAAVLADHGIDRAWISCGSTSFGLGPAGGIEAWRVGIRDPAQPEGLNEVIDLRTGAISSSGAYEQYFDDGSVRRGHVFDPCTGYAAGGVLGATVVAPTAAAADALSTACFVSGPGLIPALLEFYPEAEAVITVRAGGRALRRTTPGWKRLGRPGVSRRRFLAGLLTVLGFCLLRPEIASGVVYMTAQEALEEMLPEGRDRIKEEITLTPDQQARVSEFLGREVVEDSYTIFRVIGADPSAPIGYGVLLDVVGKERPISFLIGISPEARILGLEVLVYRESQGSEIRSKRFRQQFFGKTIEAPLRLGRDIQGISGATLSCRSTAYAVKKSLALTRVVYGLPRGGGA